MPAELAKGIIPPPIHLPQQPVIFYGIETGSNFERELRFLNNDILAQTYPLKIV